MTVLQAKWNKILKYRYQFIKLIFLRRKNGLNKNADVKLCYKRCKAKKMKYKVGTIAGGKHPKKRFLKIYWPQIKNDIFTRSAEVSLGFIILFKSRFDATS